MSRISSGSLLPSAVTSASAPADPTSDVSNSAAPAATDLPQGGDLGEFVADFKAPKITGFGHNRRHPTWGEANTILRRNGPAEYADGHDAPSGANRPGPREISNAVLTQTGSLPNREGVSDYLWQWGQFIDHDLDHTFTNPAESMPIQIPKGDPFFDPAGTGTQTMAFARSDYTRVNGKREQTNGLTSFVDGSQVYGSDPVREAWLRTNDGTGKLKTGAGDLLPFNTDGLQNDPAPTPEYFIAGDGRSNENVGLTALQTVFMREHNRICDELGKEFPWSSDEQRYQAARAMVMGEIQHVTYREFLPHLLGAHALSAYKGYRPGVDPSIDSLFSTAAFRFGHSMVSPSLRRIDANGKTIPQGDLDVKNTFFNPSEILDGGGIDPVLRGLAAQPAQELDEKIVDPLRNFLFGAPGEGGQDLGALNIQRGRDHGLPSYNGARKEFGLAPATCWADISSDKETQKRLASVYASPDDVDAWVGGLCEDHKGDGLVGPLFSSIIGDQFTRLRDGDRYWYQNMMPRSMVDWVDHQSLADIIRRNTGIGAELPDDVFTFRATTPPSA